MPGVFIGVLSDVLKLIRSQWPRDEIEVLALSRMRCVMGDVSVVK